MSLWEKYPSFWISFSYIFCFILVHTIIDKNHRQQHQHKELKHTACAFSKRSISWKFGVLCDICVCLNTCRQKLVYLAEVMTVYIQKLLIGGNEINCISLKKSTNFWKQNLSDD